MSPFFLFLPFKGVTDGDVTVVRVGPATWCEGEETNTHSKEVCVVVRVWLVAFNEPIPMEKEEEGGRRKDKG